MGHYTPSPPQPTNAAQEAIAAPCLDFTTAPCRPFIYAWLGPNQDARSVDRSPSPNRLGPRTFVQPLQQASFLPCFNGGHDKAKAKRQDQDEGPSTPREKKEQKRSSPIDQLRAGRRSGLRGHSAPARPSGPLSRAHGEPVHQPQLSRQPSLQGLPAPQAPTEVGWQAKGGRRWGSSNRRRGRSGQGSRRLK